MKNLKTNSDGKVALLYTGEKPWHGDGTECPDSFHAEKAMEAFPFTYRKESIHRPNGDKIEGRCSIVISDTDKVVGQASEDYGLVQPKDAFTFMDSVSEQGKLLYKTVGALGDGEKIWLLAHTPNHIWEAVKNDPIEDYLLFSTSYNCSRPNELRGTAIRVVCQNTFDQAIASSPALISINHTSKAIERLNMAAEVMKSYERQNKSFREAMKFLVKFPITDELIKEFELEMFGDVEKTEDESRSHTILTNKIAKFEELLVTGKGTDIKGVVGTTYGMVQAYAEYIDWFKTKTKGADRANSIVFGGGAKDKIHAVDFALQLVGVKK